jgi:hypothetical protein
MVKDFIHPSRLLKVKWVLGQDLLNCSHDAVRIDSMAAPGGAVDGRPVYAESPIQKFVNELRDLQFYGRAFGCWG